MALDVGGDPVDPVAVGPAVGSGAAQQSGTRGGPAGDLQVLTRVAPSRLYTRKGDDLVLNVPVTFAEAALGAQVAYAQQLAPTDPSPEVRVAMIEARPESSSCCLARD